MKKLSIIFALFFGYSAQADSLVLTTYDSTHYVIIEDLNTTIGQSGLTTGFSDAYYYFEPLTGNLTVHEIEWLSDGYGSELPYASTSNYTGITFDNFYTELPWLWSSDVLENLIEQYIAYQVPLQQPRIIRSIRAVKYALLQQTVNLTNLTFVRLNGHKNGTDYGVWGQTLYNYSKHSKQDGFTTNTFGLVLGIDKKLYDFFTLGIGYNYNTTQFMDMSLNNNIIFAYGQYNSDDFHLNATIGYDTGDYDTYNTIGGKTKGLFSAMMIGYNTQFNITPSFGIRYFHHDIISENDTVRPYNADTMTVVSGAAYQYQPEGSQLFLDSHLYMTYDIIRANDDIVTKVPLISYEYRYHKDMMPFGMEAGVSLNLPVGHANLSFNYDVNLRTHYISHTGMMRLRHEF